MIRLKNILCQRNIESPSIISLQLCDQSYRNTISRIILSEQKQQVQLQHLQLQSQGRRNQAAYQLCVRVFDQKHQDRHIHTTTLDCV